MPSQPRQQLWLSHFHGSLNSLPANLPDDTHVTPNRPGIPGRTTRARALRDRVRRRHITAHMSGLTMNRNPGVGSFG